MHGCWRGWASSPSAWPRRCRGQAVEAARQPLEDAAADRTRGLGLVFARLSYEVRQTLALEGPARGGCPGDGGWCRTRTAGTGGATSSGASSRRR